MFTMMQSLEIAHEIQASHRQRAATWRFRHRGQEQAEAARPTSLNPAMAPIVVLPRRVPVTSVLDVA